MLRIILKETGTETYHSKCLQDTTYHTVDFENEEIEKLLSKQSGDTYVISVDVIGVEILSEAKKIIEKL